MKRNAFLLSYLVVSILIILLGSTIAIVVGFFDPHNDNFIEAAQKAFTGIAVLSAGFLNVALIRSEGDLIVRSSCVIANLLHASIFGIAGYYSPYPAPLVWMSLFIVAAVFSMTFRGRWKSKMD